MNHEEFDNYGLRITLIADYQYEEGRKVGQFKQVLSDPGLDDVLEAVLAMVEGCFTWGISRTDLIEIFKKNLDEIGEEYRPGEEITIEVDDDY